MQKTKNLKLIMIAAIAFVVLIVIGIVVWQATKPEGTEGMKSFTFTVVDAEGNETIHKLKSDAEMLGEALLAEELIAGETGEFGIYVKTVGGITADEANQEWWCLTKGGEAVMTGADQTPLEDGAAYEFTLTVGW